MVSVLLPISTIPASSKEWQPKKHQSRPPATDLTQSTTLNHPDIVTFDGKLLKKTRPRRTVDYNGSLGRWHLLRKLRPNPYYVPSLRPVAPCVIDLLPPPAYPENASTSLCTKFVHTSTNKIRCPVNVVTWTPTARRILTGSTSGEFTLWNGLTFNFETILQAHDTSVTALTFNRSGSFLASAGKSGIIKYFEPNMNNLTAWQGSNSKEAIRGISFSPDDARFATASDDSSVRIWNFAQSRVETVFPGPPTGHGWDVKCVQWHPTKGLIASGSKDNLIKFWDPRTSTCLSTLHQHKNTVQALAWSPESKGSWMIASASRDQTVRVFDIRMMREFRVLKGHKKEVCSVAWHPYHSLLVSGGSEGAILHWDLSAPDPSTSSTTLSPTLSPRATLSQAHDSNVWSLTFHPLGHILVSASNDHTTRFWSRERPGEGGSGDKPPAASGADAGYDDDQDDQDMFAVPGFGAAMASGEGGYWGQQSDLFASKQDDNDFAIPGLGAATAGTSANTQMQIPGLGSFNPPPSQADFRASGSGLDEFGRTVPVGETNSRMNNGTSYQDPGYGGQQSGYPAQAGGYPGPSYNGGYPPQQRDEYRDRGRDYERERREYNYDREYDGRDRDRDYPPPSRDSRERDYYNRDRDYAAPPRDREYRDFAGRDRDYRDRDQGSRDRERGRGRPSGGRRGRY